LEEADVEKQIQKYNEWWVKWNKDGQRNNRVIKHQTQAIEFSECKEKNYNKKKNRMILIINSWTCKWNLIINI
jgi:hypothetical protein